MDAAAVQSTRWEPSRWLGTGKKADIGPVGKDVSQTKATSQAAFLPEKHDYKKTNDQNLMLAVATGDKMALEELYDRYIKGCYGLALKIVRDPAIAEEVVQDVFLKVWNRPESYLPERGKFSGWLLTLVHNRSVDRLRRAKTAGYNGTIYLDQDSGNGMVLADLLPDRSPTPPEEAWRSEKGSILRSALGRLPSTQREAISLAYFSGLTQREIAERLGEPLGTIKTRTRSGLLALRRMLAGQNILGEFE